MESKAPQTLRTNEPAAPRTYPGSPESCPGLSLQGGTYLARFARDEQDLERIQRLRFEVFNRELGEGLQESWSTGRDSDPFDLHCHHLMVLHTPTDTVVGTYRLQTWDMAQGGIGFYTASEFDLSELPQEMFERSIETGRACVEKDHRNGRVITLLWKGLASYLVHNKKTVLFGCCSLTSQDPHVARQTYEFLERGGFLHPKYRTRPTREFLCYPSDFVPDLDVSVKLPALFAAYLKIGALVTGEPALDREFKTIDFLALLDTNLLDPTVRRTFYRHTEEREGAREGEGVQE
ncbi:MAG TPA: GNAT family N-acyltransferase [Planctomycetota bacterium]|nr:GNAT family N-acyltransferase [Planctomycetota bacterium]